MRPLHALTALALFLPTQAHAVTAGDFLDRMNADERTGFIDGAFDMLGYELTEEGQGDKAACIIQWYFQGDGPKAVAEVFASHRDFPAVAILRKLADRHCLSDPPPLYKSMERQ
jgi:hypothetical protein